MDENIRAISQYDPAVDQRKSDLPGYRKTLDVSKLVMVEGRKPFIFHIRDLSYPDKVDVMMLPSRQNNGTSSLQADAAFRRGLVAIEGSSLGECWRPVFERAVADGGTIRAPSLADMTAIDKAVGTKLIWDIGELLIERAFLGNGTGGVG